MNFLFLAVLFFAHAAAKVQTHLDLKLSLVLDKTHSSCVDVKTCKLPYTITILRQNGSSFDMEALMMMEGHLVQRGNNGKNFNEDTIVGILPNRFMHGNRFLVRIGIFGLSPQLQDLYVLDGSKTLTHIRHKSLMYLESPGVRFRASLKLGRIVLATRMLSISNGCSCEHLECGCCEHLYIPKVHLNHTGCVNLTYLPNDYGIAFTFSLDGIVLYNDTISARNPPPICFGIPYLKEFASLCLRFHDLHVDGNRFDGCVQLQAELYHVRIAEHELGCFHIPLATTRSLFINL